MILFNHNKIVAGLSVSAVLLFAVTLFASDNYSKEDEDNLCDDLLNSEKKIENFKYPQTVLKERYAGKTDKEYPVRWPAVKQKGVETVIVTLFNLHTKEILPLYEEPGVNSLKVDYFFRSRAFGFVTDMDPRLIETIIKIAKEFDAEKISVISGYRSPKFNSLLAKKGRHVALKSRHMQGQAVDIRVDCAEAENVGKWLREWFDGGVGTYIKGNFVHIDVGPKRSWRGH